MAFNTNKDLARIFEEMALFYEIQNDRFRQRAYHIGAATLDVLDKDVKDIFEKDGIRGLGKLPGIGRGMAACIEEYIKTKKVKEYEKMKKKMPIDLKELTSVEGMGAVRAGVLYKKLKIKNINDLERAVRAHKIQKLEGFGKRSEENILQSIDFLKQNGGRMLLGDVLPYARDIIFDIKKIPGVIKVSEAGSLRRRRETIGDVDIVVTAVNSKKVLDYVERMSSVVKVWGRGSTKLSVHMEEGFDIDVRVVKKESWGTALQYFTGSKAHNIALRKIAISKKYKLNEYGLFSAQGRSASGGRKKNVVAGMDETAIYKKLGLAYIEPELREYTGEIEAAKNNKSLKVIGYNDLRGDLQIQTDWTDGKHSIEEMAAEAKKLGHEYIVITDHTKSLAMTGGSDEKRLLKQKAAIDKINHRLLDPKFKILSGAEVNILKDGSLDIEDEVLAQLDVVGVSVHSHFNLSERDMTERIIRAIGNRHVDILFHPTGRLINRRPAYHVDMERVIKEAKKTGTILEINAFPSRLDLKDEHIRMAVKLGVKMCINTDAHAKEHMHYLEYGIAQARRGWAKKKDIINTLPLKIFLASLKGGKK